jgi:hypothetical protein
VGTHVSNYNTDSENKRIAEKFIVRIYSSQPVVVERETAQSPSSTSTTSSSSTLSYVPSSLSSSSSSFPSSYSLSASASVPSFIPSSSYVPSSSFAPSSSSYHNTLHSPPSLTPSATHSAHPTHSTNTTHTPPSVSSLSLLRFIQSALLPSKFENHCFQKSLKTKKLLTWNITNNQFQADNKSQIISFNNKQISPKITEINRYSGLIDLSEDVLEIELISNIENDLKRRKYSANKIIYKEKSGIVDLTSDCSSNIAKVIEIISFQETENILILVAVNKSLNNTKLKIELETCNYNVTCPFAEKKVDFSFSNLPSNNFPSDVESREKRNLYNGKKKKNDTYDLDFILFPRSNRIIGIFVSAPLGQIMSSVRTEFERTVNDPLNQRGMEMGSSSSVKILSTKLWYIDSIGNNNNNSNNSYDSNKNNDINNDIDNHYPEKDFIKSGMPYHFAICSISE